MIKPRKRWPFALLFSIAVHAVILFILYINFSKTDTIKNSNSHSNKRTSLENKKEQLLEKVTTTALVQSSTDKEIASNRIIEDEQKIFLRTQRNDDAKTLENTGEKETLTEGVLGTNTDIVVSEQNLEPALQNRNSIDDDENILLHTATNNAGLLSTDIPKKIKETKINESEQALKAQVEDINTQLSAAINEVKERNQQKINQHRQQQAYTSISED